MTATGTVRFAAPELLPPNAQADRPPASAGAFTTVATAVVRGRGLGLSPWAKLLYVALRTYADRAGGCFPGYGALQADVGCGVNRLTRAMRELEAAGLVTRRRPGQGHPTRYTVHAPPATAPDPAPAGAQSHSQSESRVTAGVKQESPPGGVEQDSGELDPGEQHQAGPVSPLAPSPCDVSDPPGAGEDDALLAALVTGGVNPRIAQSLRITHDAQAIREQLDWRPYRPAAKNPAGALVQAIRDRWPAPPAWLEAREHTAAVTRQAEAERQRGEAEAARRREWEAKPPEERIAGRLQFWIQSRRAKRHEPTAAEIAARRGELLAELAAQAPAA